MNFLFYFLLVGATLSVSLVAGLVFTFATIIMPGIGKLDDRAFVRAFQVIDGVIQAGQPLFGLVWIGSIVSLMVASLLGLWQLEGLPKWLLLAANFLYMVGVQLPTLTTNVPLNNRLQAVNFVESSDDTIRSARQEFEVRWNHYNNFRTVVAVVVTLILIVILIL